MDPMGQTAMVRQVRQPRHAMSIWFPPHLLDKQSNMGMRGRLEYLSPEGYRVYYSDGLPKRNFDEIDRSGLDNFVRKRNFDEIDQTSMPFPYSKRVQLFRMANKNLDKKQYLIRQFDEIDNSLFPIGSKRASDYGPQPSSQNLDKKQYLVRHFDEIDNSLFPIGSKRTPDYGPHSSSIRLDKKQFDEIDNSLLPIGG